MIGRMNPLSVDPETSLSTTAEWMFGLLTGIKHYL